jgi:hypothetical protein
MFGWREGIIIIKLVAKNAETRTMAQARHCRTLSATN